MRFFHKFLQQSIHVMFYHAAGCGGCSQACLACFGSEMENEGIDITGNPKHADVLIVTGSVNSKGKSVLQNIFRQMASPKAVIAAGTCACSAKYFHRNDLTGIAEVVPVKVFVKGCSIEPKQVLKAIYDAAEKISLQKETKGKEEKS